jgi:spore germination protein GerM
MEEPKKKETVNLLFLLLILALLSVLLHFVYFKPEVLGLEIREFGALTYHDSDVSNVQQEKHILYFADPQWSSLVTTECYISHYENPVERAKVILTELFKGPKDNQSDGIIPLAIGIRALYLMDEVLILDLSRDIVQKIPGGLAHESYAIYSIVNTVCQCKEISRVRFLVDGKPMDTLAGHINLRHSILPRTDLLTAAVSKDVK